jgi:hypothetical protein
MGLLEKDVKSVDIQALFGYENIAALQLTFRLGGND